MAAFDWTDLQAKFVAYQEGDLLAVRPLFERLACYVDTVGTTMAAKSVSSEILHELKQDVLIELHVSREQYAADQDFETWVAGIVERKLNNRWKPIARGFDSIAAIEHDVATQAALARHWPWLALLSVMVGLAWAAFIGFAPTQYQRLPLAPSLPLFSAVVLSLGLSITLVTMPSARFRTRAVGLLIFLIVGAFWELLLLDDRVLNIVALISSRIGWSNGWRCFGLGLVASAFIGLQVTAWHWRLRIHPSSRTRMGAVLAASICGLTAQSFYCADLPHAAWPHLGQAATAALLVLAAEHYVARSWPQARSATSAVL